MKRLDSNSGFSAIEIIMVIALLACIGLAGWYIWNNNQNSGDPDAARSASQEANATNDQTKDASTISNQTSMSTASDSYTSAPLREVSLDEYGTKFKLPSDWTEGGGTIGKSIGYQGIDTKNKIYITLSISRDVPDVSLGCFLIARDSEDLQYDNPLPGQRTTTKITFSTASNETKTLCGVMITGAYSAKTGDVFSPYDKTLQESLPNNRIVAYISTDPYTDPITNETISWPKIETAMNSPKYAELIAALKSIQVK